MRASQLINILEYLIQQCGDCYVTHAAEGDMYGMEKVEKIEVVTHFETTYFCAK
jgi:AhpD family alkylhydroperoxidase